MVGWYLREANPMYIAVILTKAPETPPGSHFVDLLRLTAKR